MAFSKSDQRLYEDAVSKDIRNEAIARENLEALLRTAFGHSPPKLLPVRASIKDPKKGIYFPFLIDGKFAEETTKELGEIKDSVREGKQKVFGNDYKLHLQRISTNHLLTGDHGVLNNLVCGLYSHISTELQGLTENMEGVVPNGERNYLLYSSMEIWAKNFRKIFSLSRAEVHKEKESFMERHYGGEGLKDFNSDLFSSLFGNFLGVGEKNERNPLIGLLLDDMENLGVVLKRKYEVHHELITDLKRNGWQVDSIDDFSKEGKKYIEKLVRGIEKGNKEKKIKRKTKEIREEVLKELSETQKKSYEDFARDYGKCKNIRQILSRFSWKIKSGDALQKREEHIDHVISPDMMPIDYEIPVTVVNSDIRESTKRQSELDLSESDLRDIHTAVFKKVEEKSKRRGFENNIINVAGDCIILKTRKMRYAFNFAYDLHTTQIDEMEEMIKKAWKEGVSGEKLKVKLVKEQRGDQEDFSGLFGTPYHKQTGDISEVLERERENERKVFEKQEKTSKRPLGMRTSLASTKVARGPQAYYSNGIGKTARFQRHGGYGIPVKPHSITYYLGDRVISDIGTAEPPEYNAALIREDWGDLSTEDERITERLDNEDGIFTDEEAILELFKEKTRDFSGENRFKLGRREVIFKDKSKEDWITEVVRHEELWGKGKEEIYSIRLRKEPFKCSEFPTIPWIVAIDPERIGRIAFAYQKGREL